LGFFWGGGGGGGSELVVDHPVEGFEVVYWLEVFEGKFYLWGM